MSKGDATVQESGGIPPGVSEKGQSNTAKENAAAEKQQSRGDVVTAVQNARSWLLEDINRDYDRNRANGRPLVGSDQRYTDYLRFDQDYQESFTDKNLQNLSENDVKEKAVHFVTVTEPGADNRQDFLTGSDLGDMGGHTLMDDGEPDPVTKRVRFHEGLPINGLLSSLDTLAIRKPELAEKIQETRDIIVENSKPYVEIYGKKGQIGPNRILYHATQAAKDAGREAPTDADLKAAEKKLRDPNYRELVLPPKDPKKVAEEIRNMPDVSPTEALQLLAQNPAETEDTGQMPQPDTGTFNFQTGENVSPLPPVIEGHAPRNNDTRMAVSENGLADSSSTDRGNTAIPSAGEQAFVDGDWARPVDASKLTNVIDVPFTVTPGEKPAPESVVYSEDPLSRPQLSSGTEVAGPTGQGAATETSGDIDTRTPEEIAAAEEAHRAAVARRAELRGSGTQRAGDTDSTSQTRSGSPDAPRPLTGTATEQPQRAAPDGAGARTTTEARTENGNRTFPYYDDEPGPGMTVAEIKTQFPKSWTTAESLIAEVQRLQPRPTTESQNDYQTRIYEAVIDQLRNPGNHENNPDAISRLLAGTQMNRPDQVLMALEAQRLSAPDDAENARLAREENALLATNNRREVQTVASHKTERTNVEGNLDKYFLDRPAVGQNGEKAGVPEAKLNPKRDLYAVTLVSDRLLDVINPDSNHTYREQMAALQKIIDDKGKTPEGITASKRLVTLRRDFYIKAFDAMLSIDQPGHVNTDPASQTPTDKLLIQMHQKIDEARNMKIKDLIAQYKGVGTDATAGRAMSDNTKAEMERVFGVEYNRHLLEQAVKGMDLMIRRISYTTRTREANPNIRIPKKRYIQGPTDTQPNAPVRGVTGGPSGENRRPVDGAGAPPTPTREPGTPTGRTTTTTNTGEPERTTNGTPGGQNGRTEEPGRPPAVSPVTVEGGTPAPVVRQLETPPVAPPVRQDTTPGGQLENPPVAPPGGGENQTPIDPNRRFVGVVGDDTEAQAQRVTLDSQEVVNKSLREKKWPAVFDWIRRGFHRNFESVRRQNIVERNMRALRGENRGLFGRRRQEAIAAEVMRGLDRSSAATAERLANMTREQALAQGEDLRILDRNDAVQNEIRQRLIDDIVRPVAMGRATFTRDSLQEYFRNFTNEHRGTDVVRELFGADSNAYGYRAQEFAVNLVKMGEEIGEHLNREQNATEAGFNALDDRIDIVLARARANVHGNTHDLIDRAMVAARRRHERIAQTGKLARPLLAIATNPALWGIGTTIALQATMSPARTVARIFAPLVGGAVVGSVFAGIRKNQEVGRDNRFTEVSMGMGRVSTEENRKAYQEIYNERNAASATELINGGGIDQATGRPRRSVADLLAVLNNRANLGTPAYNNAGIEARSRLAEIVIRERIGGEVNKQLVKFTVGQDAEQRNELQKIENQLMDRLGFYHTDPTTGVRTPVSDRDTFLHNMVGRQMQQWENPLHESQRDADASLRVKRLKEVGKAMVWSAGTSLIGGTVLQEAGALGLRAYHHIKGDNIAVGPTLFERTVNGAATHGPLKDTGLGQILDAKTSGPPSIDEFKDAFNNPTHDIRLANGMKLHPDGLVQGHGMKMALVDGQGQRILDASGKPMDIPMFIQPNGEVLLEADINKLQLPNPIKGAINEFSHKSVDTPFTQGLKQAVANANKTGNPVTMTMANPLTGAHEQVFPGGKIWFTNPTGPSHVMGTIDPSTGSIQFTGMEQEIQGITLNGKHTDGLYDGFKKAGWDVTTPVGQDHVSLHERLSDFLEHKSDPVYMQKYNNGVFTTDDGRAQLTVNSDNTITLKDLTDPTKPEVTGLLEKDIETKLPGDTWLKNPQTPRGILYNIRIKGVGDLAANKKLYEDLNKGYGFTGDADAESIYVAAPDVYANAKFTANPNHFTLFTPPTVVGAPLPIPTPIDPRKPLGGYGAQEQAQRRPNQPQAAHTPTPAGGDHPVQTDIPAPAPTPNAAGAHGAEAGAAQGAIPAPVQAIFDNTQNQNIPAGLRGVIGNAYRAHTSPIEALETWRAGHQTEAAQVTPAQFTALQAAIQPPTPAANGNGTAAHGATPAAATPATPAAGAHATPAQPAAADGHTAEAATPAAGAHGGTHAGGGEHAAHDEQAGPIKRTWQKAKKIMKKPFSGRGSNLAAHS